MAKLYAILFFIVYPVAEIAVLILVGRRIGVWPTVGLCLAAAALGIGLVRVKGSALVAEVRSFYAATGVQPPPATAAASIPALLAGPLFIVPGFLSDAMAVALLTPPLRRLATRWLVRALARRALARSQPEPPRPQARPKRLS